MNFIFKIFGAPYGFELYQGTESELNYFRTFDNGNRENVKLTIHHMASGQVSYSYLRYNFKTSGGRDNSFFGMSVVFTGEYCADTESLYNLFDTVYKTILQNKILFEEVKGNPNTQAKYFIRNFAEAETEVKRIENIICKNIENEFADDIRPLPLDNSFKQGNSNLIVKLNDKKGNATFLKALHECSWVSISPEYKDEVLELSPETIADLDETIEEVQKNIADISIDALKGANVSKDIEIAWKQIKNGTDTIQPYLKIQPELQERNNKIITIQKQLSDLSNLIPKNSGNSITPKPEEEVVTTGEKNDDNSKKKEPKPPTDSKRKHILNEYKSHFIAVVVLIILVAGGVSAYQYFSKETLPAGGNVLPSDPTENLIVQGNAALNNNDFDTAIEKFTEAKRTDLVKNAKTQAVQYWQGEAASVAKAVGTEKTNAKKIEKLKLAISNLEKTKDYGGYSNLKKDMAEFQKEIERLNAPPAVIPATPVKPNETNLSIEVSKDGKVTTDYNVKVGELFSIKVTGNNGGQWRSSDTNKLRIQDKTKTTTAMKFWEEGQATLSFLDANGNVVKSITFTITSPL